MDINYDFMYNMCINERTNLLVLRYFHDVLVFIFLYLRVIITNTVKNKTYLITRYYHKVGTQQMGKQRFH